MGLKDIIDGPMYPVGSVESRMKPKNAEMPDDWWQEVVAPHNPELLFWHTGKMSKEQVKLFIELLDNVIQDNVPNMVMSDDQVRRARDVREDLVDVLNKKD